MKMSKKMLSIILALVIAITCVIPVFADTYATSGTCGENVTWEFDVPTRTLTISGTGEMDSSPWSTYKEIIKTVIIESGVTCISNSAFIAHTALTNVYIADTITNIYSYAFSNCVALTSIVIPDNVGYIGSYAFRSCSALKDITIGAGVSSISYDAFSGCNALKNVYIKDLSSWCNISFNEYDSNPLFYASNLYLNGELITDLIIPEDVTKIKNYAFYNCDSITSATIDNDVTTIGSEAFAYCSNLATVTLGNSVTTINSLAFYICDSLTSVNISQSVTSISEDSFRGCRSLTEVNVSNDNATYKSIDGVLFSKNMVALLLYPSAKADEKYIIPDDVLIIKDYAFANNDYLKNVTISNTVATIGNYSFFGCGSLVEIVIPDEVVSVGQNAFSLCENLKKATIGNGVARISIGMFEGCKNLINVTIPNSVTLIDDSAFLGCINLTNIAIPDSVKKIGEHAFYECKKLDSVVIGSGITNIGWEAFGYYSPWDDDIVKHNVYYNGTEEQWNSISISSQNYFNNIHYNCTNPDGHYTLTKVVNPSTCRDEGYSEYTCPCGYTLVKDYTYLDHTPGDWNISQYPTCTKPGHKYQRCTGCGVWLNDESIPATGHNAGEWQSIAPTCTESGLEGKCCTSCGELLEGEIIAALGGSHTYGDWEDDGVNITRKCSKCGYVVYSCLLKLAADKTDVNVGDKITVKVNLSEKSGLATLTIKAKYDATALSIVDMKSGDLGATVNSKTGVATMAAATTFEEAGTVCVVTFEAIKSCETNIEFDITEACDIDFNNMGVTINSVKVTVGEESTTEPEEPSTEPDYPDDPTEPEDPCADGHIWSTWATVKVAECKKEGLKDRKCTVCGEKETEVIPATGACAYKWVVTKEATATEYGEKQLKCTMCGHVKETQKLAPKNPCADGHNYTSTVTAPTCTEQGYTTYTCTTCGDKYKDDYTSATGHNYTWYTISVVTCETDGVMLGECTVCGATDVKATLKTGHNIVDGVCQNCGYTENGENDNTNTDDNENVGNEDNNNEEVTDPSDNCSCNCHKSGISNFFFKIGLFFQKIFGSNKYCGCGVAHY